MTSASGLLSVLEELVTRRSPQWLYSYKMRPLLRFGSLGLSSILVLYGVTYTDMTWFSANKRQEAATEEERRDWKFWVKVYGPLGMAILPFTLSLGTLWTFSRMVSKIEFIPKVQGSEGPMFKLTRSSMFGRRVRQSLIGINDLAKTKHSRIFTGKGSQGLEDKGTFCFYLVNRSEGVPRWNKHYIVSRAGQVWKSDGKILETLFSENSKVKENSLLQEVIQSNKDKRSFHSNSLSQKNTIKNIILNTRTKD